LYYRQAEEAQVQSGTVHKSTLLMHIGRGLYSGAGMHGASRLRNARLDNSSSGQHATDGADLLAMLGIAEEHEGDHLDFAVLVLLHAPRHPLQHRPRAKALGQLLLLLPDLRPGTCTRIAALLQLVLTWLLLAEMGSSLLAYAATLGGTGVVTDDAKGQRDQQFTSKPRKCILSRGSQLLCRHVPTVLPHLDAALGLALDELDLFAARPDDQLHLRCTSTTTFFAQVDQAC
jgi:hypothetical protein